MTFVPYQSAKEVVDAFINLLHDNQISPPAGSRPESELLSMTQLLHDWKNPATHSGNTQLLRDAAGAHDLAAKVLCARQCPEFRELLPHLKMLAEAPDYARVTQLTRGDGRDDLSRKYAELYLACLAIHCGEGLRLDHPQRSRGDNPDVMLQFMGRTWALAVKTISSTQGQTVYENMLNAAVQIERSGANHGLIVINTKNVIAHDDLWKASFANEHEATQAIISQVRQICANAEENRSDEEWRRIFARPKVVAPVLFMAQSLVALPIGDAQVPTPLKAIAVEPFGQALHPDAMELAESINMFMALLVGSHVPALRTISSETD